MNCVGTSQTQIIGMILKRCLFLFQLPGRMLWDSKTHSKVESDPGFQSCTSSPRVLWPLIDPEEELKKQVATSNLSQTCPLQRSHMTPFCFSTASVSFPDAPTPVHECWEEASERKPTAQETHKKDGKVTTALFHYHFLDCWFVIKAVKCFKLFFFWLVINMIILYLFIV